MKNKELKHLSRGELLELLLAQTKETERLRKRLEEAEALLASRHLKVMEAGDLAHAVLAVNNVMEAAQAAADQFLQNIATMEAETRETCQRMIREAAEEAAKIRRGEETGVKNE